MKISLSRKILIGFIACAVVLLAVAVFSYGNNKKFLDANAWVDHTNVVISEFSVIQALSLDALSSERGYILSGDDRYLEPYDDAKLKSIEHLNHVRELTRDNPTQQRNITELERVNNGLIKFMDDCIAARKKSFDASKVLVATGEGRRLEDDLRKVVRRSVDLEQTLLAERRKTSEEETRNFNLIFLVLLVVIMAVLVAVYLIITTNLRALNKAEAEAAARNWLLTGTSQMNDKIQGEREVADMARDVIAQLTTYIGGQIGALYVMEEGHLNMVGTYAFNFEKGKTLTVKPGEGLVGQAAIDKNPIIVNDVPANYLKISSGLGNNSPKSILVVPFLYADQVKGVLEIGSNQQFAERDLQLLKLISENLGIAINSSQGRAKVRELLEETQRQSEELQTQQEELRQVNEELEEQQQNLKQQQEELQITNEELEEQTQALELKNQEVEAARADIEQKGKQLEQSSRYKSEFLANMSHELRTPLNSLLILSRELSENKKGNLSKDQVESADIIYKSGRDLLALINEVLDLSKIEAGKMTLNVEQIEIKDLADSIMQDFKHYAEKKGLLLKVIVNNNAPEAIKTDEQRLGQILKNLISNAIKFTEKGGITVNIEKTGSDKISISVTDTGIGIASDKYDTIFEAFRQADGGTSRKYGGTGLGLSISRELVRLLGGEIKLNSVLDQGSTFTIVIPAEIQGGETSAIPPSSYGRVSARAPVKEEQMANYPSIPDDRDVIKAEDKVVLVIEDDLKFATVLLKQAHEKGFKCLATPTGEEGLKMAQKFLPGAIILDIELPGIDGHQVLTELKSNPATRHIPVHIMSVEERSLRPIKDGAVAYLNKPIEKQQLEEAFNRIENFISRKMKNLLIVEDDANSRKAIKTLIGNGDVKCLEAGTAHDALKLFSENHIDCIVLDIGLPDASGFELIHMLGTVKPDVPPVIIYTGKELTKAQNDELQKYAESIIIKGVKSEERLLDETALFLHRTISNLPEPKQNIIASLYSREAAFQDKTVLVVDDDMRNVFALSKVLKDRGLEVLKADNGAHALEVLDKAEKVDIVLMDIMMPEMDGYEAMQCIRQQERFKDLAIIALTAKAMKDDRQKCIDAGANDYISKPVDVERLLTLMRVWLSK